jgi:anti-anti-sigma factor
MGQNERENLFERTFPGQLAYLTAISDFVVESARRLGMGEHDLFSIQMAVDEAATNIIAHGYEENELEGEIHILCWQEGQNFVVQLRDNSPPFDPTWVPEPDLNAPLQERREGGLGIFLMRRMMDWVEFSREGDQNVLSMARRIAVEERLPPDAVVVAPQGRADAAHALEWERMFQGPLEAGKRFLIINLSQVTYISSSALRILLVVAKQVRGQGGELLLCCPTPIVSRVLRVSGFNKIFALYETEEVALRALEELGES